MARGQRRAYDSDDEYDNRPVRRQNGTGRLTILSVALGGALLLTCGGCMILGLIGAAVGPKRDGVIPRNDGERVANRSDKSNDAETKPKTKAASDRNEQIPKPAEDSATTLHRPDTSIHPLVGKWNGVYFELAGTEQTVDKKAGKTWEWDFASDKVSIYIPGSERMVLPWRVDDRGTPHTIDFGMQDSPVFKTAMVGVYEVAGDRLTVCVRMGNDQSNRPKTFATIMPQVDTETLSFLVRFTRLSQ